MTDSTIYTYANAAIFTLFLSSCAALPNINNGELFDAKIAAHETAIPAQWQITSDVVATSKKWPELFTDTLLQDYIRTTLTANLTLEQGQARLQQVQARLKRSKTAFLPFISANTSLSGSSFLSDANITENIGGALSASYKPDFFGRTRADVRGAAAQAAAELAQLDQLKNALAAQTVLVYVRTIEADLQLSLARENLSFLVETRRISEARYDTGDIAGDDLALSRLEVDNATANVLRLEFTAREARRTLALLTGGFDNTNLVVASDLPKISPLPKAGFPANIITRRDDIIAAKAVLVSRLATLDKIAANRWPLINLSGQIGASGSVRKVFDLDQWIGSLTTALTQKVFDGGAQGYAEQEARSAIDESLAVYAEALRQAVREVNSAYDDSVTTFRILGELDKAEIEANKTLEIAKIKYALGEIVLLDVLSIQRQVNSIKASRIRAQTRFLEAQIAGYLAIGDLK